MSYTSTQQLRGHFPTERPLAVEIQDQTLTLRGLEMIPFYGAAVEAASVVVKRASRGHLQRQQISLTSSGSVLSGSRLVAQSVVVASNSSFTNQFAEQIDYEVDYLTATIRRINSGAIVEGESVAVWFEAHTVFVVGSDFLVDADRGTIRRTNSGMICDSERVLIDYRPISLSVPDELLTQAVSVANQQIAHEIDPAGEYEADALLGLAATYRAQAIACEGAASRELSKREGSAQVATSWINLAERHERRSRELIGQFRPPVLAPSSPQHT